MAARFAAAVEDEAAAPLLVLAAAPSAAALPAVDAPGLSDISLVDRQEMQPRKVSQRSPRAMETRAGPVPRHPRCRRTSLSITGPTLQAKQVRSTFGRYSSLNTVAYISLYVLKNERRNCNLRSRARLQIESLGSDSACTSLRWLLHVSRDLGLSHDTDATPYQWSMAIQMRHAFIIGPAAFQTAARTSSSHDAVTLADRTLSTSPD